MIDETKSAPADGTQPSDAGMTAAQIETFKSDMQRAGRSEREIQAALARAGTGEAPPPPIVPIEGLVPASAREYVIPRPIVTADGTVADATLRAGFEAAGLPAEIGTALADEIARSNEQYRNMDELGRKIDTAATLSKLREQWKDDSERPARLELVTQLVGEIDAKVPGFRKMLNDTGADNNPRLITHLELHARRVRSAKWGPGGTMEKKAKAAEVKQRAGHASTLMALDQP